MRSTLSAIALGVALAAQSAPPAEPGPFEKADLVEVVKVDKTIRLDVRYATANNFLGRPVYASPRAFLQRAAALALARANRRLRRDGYGIVVFDGYRPWSVTKLFWDATPEAQRAFVADPSKGSRHNRGCAADVTLFDLKTGAEVEMPSGYDDFSERAHPSYAGGSAEARRLRDLLRARMEAEGFSVYENEWWHFDFKGYERYAILDVPFERIR